MKHAKYATAIAASLLLLGLVGCSSSGTSAGTSGTGDVAPSAFPANQFSPVIDCARTGHITRAVCVGWNSVLPSAYNGWDGALSDCESDAQTWADKFRGYGIPTALLKTSNATVARCRGALRTALTGMKAGDDLLVSISGHGGQRADTDGDESDHKDEYLCAYDQPVLDDTIHDWLNRVPAGVRITWICDTCNSGTMVRSAPPVVFRRRAIPRSFSGELILMAGCNDGESSMSTGEGGQWTLSLSAMGPGQGAEAKSPRKWFDLGAAYMMLNFDNQIPVFTTYKASGDFINGPLIK